jgi:hypothetical protein
MLSYEYPAYANPSTNSSDLRRQRSAGSLDESPLRSSKLLINGIKRCFSYSLANVIAEDATACFQRVNYYFKGYPNIAPELRALKNLLTSEKMFLDSTYFAGK